MLHSGRHSLDNVRRAIFIIRVGSSLLYDLLLRLVGVVRPYPIIECPAVNRAAKEKLLTAHSGMIYAAPSRYKWRRVQG